MVNIIVRFTIASMGKKSQQVPNALFAVIKPQLPLDLKNTIKMDAVLRHAIFSFSLPGLVRVAPN